MPVVSISLNYVSTAHLAVKIIQLKRRGFEVSTNFSMPLKYNFWAFLIVVHQNKCHLWNPEAKLDMDNIAKLQNENFVFGDLTLFDLSLT